MSKVKKLSDETKLEIAQERQKKAEEQVNKLEEEKRVLEVEVAKSTEEKKNDEIEELKKLVAEQQKSIGILTQVADKRALANYWERHKEAMPPKAKVRTFGGKLVLSTKLLKNEVYKEPSTGILRENQILEVVFSDGTKEEMEYLYFIRNHSYVDVTITKTENEGSDIIYTVKVDKTGEEAKINCNMIN